MRLPKILIGSALVTCAAFFVSCDIVEAPYEETPDIPDTNTVELKQNVLMEDFTGHVCGNCPEGTVILRQLEATYGERLIVISVHAGTLSWPQPPDYPTDFRTTEGNLLNSTFKNDLIGLPNGHVNRVPGPKGIVHDKDSWAEAVAAQLNAIPTVDLKLARAYDSTTRTVILDVDVKYLEAGTADDNIVAVLTESNIISDQKDYDSIPQHIENYEFDNVLRSSFNGVWGEPLSTTVIAKGTTIKKQLTYTLPADKSWVPANCDVVVYVHRHNTTKQVLQAQKVSLTGQ